MIVTYSATRIWEAELRRGVGGQDRQKPSTWVMDALYKAVCCEANAREAFAARNDAAGFGWLDSAREYLAREARRIAA